jgi:hypothetical protein
MGGRKVMDWVSLFQGCEDEVMLKSNELSHYSCTRLLRKMEAAGSGSDEEMEAEMVGVDDGELVSIPGSWLDSGNKHEEDNGLLENLYILPELKSSESVVVNCNGEGDDLGLENGNKSKWGPVPVEKRPCRRPKDGRTIMEKAQERKKVYNLEVLKGINSQSNPFSVLSYEKISSIASTIGVNLGCSEYEIGKSTVLLQECDRDLIFEQNCKPCQEKTSDSVEFEKGDVGEEETSQTPPDQIFTHQVDESVDPLVSGPW